MSADLDYIRRNVPVESVAEDLGLDRRGTMWRCFRPDAHQNGDRTPSMSKARNNRMKCFVCDPQSISNIDLVMTVNDVPLPEAVKWITQRFPGIPQTPKGKHLSHKARGWDERSRVGASASGLEYVIRSGVWASFSHAERALLPVLDMYADPTKRMVQISYQGMMRYSGIGSRATIAKALRVFQKLNLIQSHKGKDEGLSACGVYTLTFDDPDFLRYASGLQSKNREAIAVERDLRKKSRDQRRSTRAFFAGIKGNILCTPSEPVPEITVHSDCTAISGNSQIDAEIEFREGCRWNVSEVFRKLPKASEIQAQAVTA